jgi:hypothetical protein
LITFEANHQIPNSPESSILKEQSNISHSKHNRSRKGDKLSDSEESLDSYDSKYKLPSSACDRYHTTKNISYKESSKRNESRQPNLNSSRHHSHHHSHHHKYENDPQFSDSEESLHSYNSKHKAPNSAREHSHLQDHRKVVT